MSKCVFLDRDGVLNQDIEGYLYDPDLLIFPVGVKEGLERLKRAGYLLIVVTNQAGIAKGEYTGADVLKIHQRMQEEYGGVLDDLYFAPDHPEYSSRSLSRKPGSLMLERAMARYAIDGKASWMIGDRERDIEAGKNAGVRTVRISNAGQPTAADFRADNFTDAVRYILDKEN